MAAVWCATASEAAPAQPKATQKQDLQAIQKEVKRLETGIKSAKEAELSLSNELGRLEKLLKLQALEIQLSSIELERLEEHVQEMTMRRDSLQQSIGTRKQRLRGFLSLLPAFESRSPLARLSEDDAIYLSQYRELLAKTLKHDREEILSLRKVLLEVENLNKKLQEDRERLLAHTEDLKEKQIVLALNQKMKSELLRKTRSEQTARLRVYQAAKAAEGELESMLSRFNLAAEMKRQQEVESATLPEPRQGASFASRKGALQLPITGKIVNVFGKKYDPKTSLYTFHKGVDIAAGPAAPVKAVFSGKVVYSGKIGGYGQLLILDHGDQYYSLVGHLGEMKKKEGDSVKEGEVIASSALDSSPVYFEIRQRHIAVNPLPWFANN
jgi:septal ring factor EnvC (AmiA/AmiB activator)